MRCGSSIRNKIWYCCGLLSIDRRCKENMLLLYDDRVTMENGYISFLVVDAVNKNTNYSISCNIEL